VSMTTREIEQAALAVPCPEHRVSEGKACPVRPGGAFGDACMDRRDLAEARRRLAVFPSETELAAMDHGDVARYALCLRDAALALSACVDTALGLS
jgi:hypothetical protein